MASDPVVDQVRRAVDLVELVSSHTTLKRVGNRFSGLCPFHKERSPSFSVDPDKGFYHCFGCGAGGDVFRFVMETEGKTFPEALEDLARKTGIELPRRSGGDARRREQQRGERQAMLDVTRTAALFFRRALKEAPADAPVRRYIEERGFELEQALAFGLGAAPAGWDGLARELARGGDDIATALKVGLVAERSNGGHYDRFRERLIFTILSADGTPIGFGARLLGDGEGPKYINSGDSDIFHKGQEFYGLSWARKAIRDKGRALIVEGYFDVLTLHANGFEETVAALGTALTAEHAQRIKRYTSEVLLVFDGDDAGRRAAERSLPHFLAADVRPRAVFLPRGEDPDTCLRSMGAEAFERFLTEAPPLLEHWIRERARTAAGDARLRASAVRDAAPLLAAIPDPVEREITTGLLARELDIPEHTVRAGLARSSTPNVVGRRDGAPPPVAPERARPLPPAERELVLLLARRPELAQQIESGLDSHFQVPSAGRFVAAAAEHPQGTAADWLHGIEDPQLTSLVAAASIHGEDSTDDEVDRKLLADCTHRIRSGQVERELERIKREMREKEASGDTETLSWLQQRYIELKRGVAPVAVGKAMKRA